MKKGIALALIVAGVLALVYRGFSYTKERHEAKLGPLVLERGREGARLHPRLGRRHRDRGRSGPAARRPEEEVGARMRAAALAVTLGTLAASPALANDGGGALVLAAPRGALAEQADIAGGLGGHSCWRQPLPARWACAWTEAGCCTAARRCDIPVARTAGRLVREITTENWVAQAGIGPQIAFPVGGVRPYVHAFVGASYLSTTSELRDPDGFVSASSTNYDDTGFVVWRGRRDPRPRRRAVGPPSISPCATCAPDPCVSWPRATWGREGACRPCRTRGRPTSASSVGSASPILALPRGAEPRPTVRPGRALP